MPSTVDAITVRPESKTAARICSKQEQRLGSHGLPKLNSYTMPRKQNFSFSIISTNRLLLIQKDTPQRSANIRDPDTVDFRRAPALRAPSQREHFHFSFRQDSAPDAFSYSIIKAWRFDFARASRRRVRSSRANGDPSILVVIR